MQETDNQIIAAMDIGSSKIVTIIAEVYESNESNREINILGYGIASTNGGIKQGVIQNIELVVEAMKASIEMAENQASQEVEEVYVGISSSSIETINVSGAVGISGADKEIRIEDITNAIDNAKAVAMPFERYVLHTIPQSYSVDGGDWIKYPLGVVGTRLECQIHMITSLKSSMSNIMKCFTRCDVKVKQFVLQNLANADSLLEEAEKELGVLLLDIGAETTKISVYYKNVPFYNRVLPLGGKYITSDIAAGCHLQQSVAEQIKIAYGVADFSYVDENEYIEIPHVGGRAPMRVPRGALVPVIGARVKEIFSLVRDDLQENGMLDKMGGGIVLTGGTANLPGIVEVCQEIFNNIQTRVGNIPKYQGLGEKFRQPENSVAFGLILWGYALLENETQPNGSHKNGDDSGFFNKVKDIFKNMFYHSN